MAFSKANLYPEPLRLPSFYAKALSHPERIAIMMYLVNNGPTHVNELVDNSILSQPAVSQHLAILRKTGLVDYEVRTPNIFYSVNKDAVEVALRQLGISLVQSLST